MQTSNTLANLLLCSTIVFSQYTLASSFCTTSAEGKIRVDDCNYTTYDECKRAAVNQGDCVVNEEDKPSSSGVAPYCIVTWSTECRYFDYKSCTQAAQEKKGFCYLNPDYKESGK